LWGMTLNYCHPSTHNAGPQLADGRVQPADVWVDGKGMARDSAMRKTLLTKPIPHALRGRFPPERRADIERSNTHQKADSEAQRGICFSHYRDTYKRTAL
jgi:hypothetical protein